MIEKINIDIINNNRIWCIELLMKCDGNNDIELKKICKNKIYKKNFGKTMYYNFCYALDNLDIIDNQISKVVKTFPTGTNLFILRFAVAQLINSRKEQHIAIVSGYCDMVFKIFKDDVMVKFINAVLDNLIKTYDNRN